jgi:hypothetical protein
VPLQLAVARRGEAGGERKQRGAQPEKKSGRQGGSSTKWRGMGLPLPSPSVPRRDGEGAYKQVGEPAPIASNRPRLGGLTQGYTSDMHRTHANVKHMRMAPPRPAETNASHNDYAAEKTLKEYTLLQGFGG